MAEDQESIDAKFREFTRSRDGIDVAVRLAAASMGIEVLDKAPEGSYVWHVQKLVERRKAGELTEEQYRAEVRNLRPMLRENIHKAESGE